MESQNKVLEKNVIEVDIAPGEIADLEVKYKPGFDPSRIRHIRKDCNCTEPEIWLESIKGKYHDDGICNGIMQTKEKNWYIFYNKEGISKEEEAPLFVVNDAGQQEPNWYSENLLWERVMIIVTVRK